jgi:hypothetical protein
MSPAHPEDEERPSHALNSRLSAVDHFAPGSDGLGATQVLGGSHGPRPSLMAAVMRPSSMMRPSVVTDLSNNFSEAKIHDAHVQVFASDVLMEGQLTKKGEAGLQAWKHVGVRTSSYLP